MNAPEKKEFHELIGKYLDGRTTAEETQLLDSYYQLFADGPNALESIPVKEQELIGISLHKKIKQRTGQKPAVPIYRTWPRTAVAVAAAIALIITGVYFFGSADYSSNFTENDIAPGKNGASLTLGNGQVIILEGDKKGLITGEKLTYTDGSEIQYSSKTSSGEIPEMLSASTSTGQTYEITLPDGTRVWLNAASKITFPSRFNGKHRSILLSGEAYFAVKHDSKQPFRVESKGQTVEDIGTEFNIQAYPDETEVKTTLVEGLASVTPSNQQHNKAILHPNQQSILKDKTLHIQPADTGLETAWKQGVFIFKSERIGNLMKRVERWYNVKIVYEDSSLADTKFSGTISRYENISKLLDILQTTGQIHFQISGNQITVSQ